MKLNDLQKLNDLHEISWLASGEWRGQDLCSDRLAPQSSAPCLQLRQ